MISYAGQPNAHLPAARLKYVARGGRGPTLSLVSSRADLPEIDRRLYYLGLEPIAAITRKKVLPCR